MRIFQLVNQVKLELSDDFSSSTDEESLLRETQVLIFPSPGIGKSATEFVITAVDARRLAALLIKAAEELEAVEIPHHQKTRTAQ